MLKHLCIIGIIVASVSATSEPMMKCPKYEEYKDCAVGACINTCARPQISLTCKAPCFPGCGCIKDYLRNRKGVCVPPEKCDGCPRHEMLVVKLGKITCENTCAQPDLGTRCTALISGPTCRCKPGYLRNSNGKCVRPVKCGQELPVQYQKKCPKTGESVCLCSLNEEQKIAPTPDVTGKELPIQDQKKCPKTGKSVCLCGLDKEQVTTPTPDVTG
ncbi:uncharacterized protein LOC143912919 isoform X2 [Arctopsyche grandis]|uniref:uncharacterized protein LOC143912919 isoform X2 n=1 Tax=Arctopsyche grandis TaxID=121162 RepID=UPI00406DA0BC